jgi:hypothetical protein
MRYFACLLVALSICARLLDASDAPQLTSVQQEVLKVHNAIREAAGRRDVAAFAGHVAEDCIFSTDDGIIETKAQFIELLSNLPTAYDRLENPRDYIVHVYQRTAVVSYRVTGHEQFTDADIISEQRRMEIYTSQNGSWLLVARQWENLPVNFRKPSPVDTGIYREYIGQYEWRPHGDVDIVSVKDGKLWSRMGKNEDEYLPLGSDTFFIRADLGSVTFLRDARGQVTSYTYQRMDGQEIHVRKIK